MEEMTEQEIEQLKRLELIRKQLQIILKSHLVLMLVVFFMLLGGILSLVYIRVAHSSNRYIARISLHYYPKQPGKIPPYEENFMLQIFNRPALRSRFFDAVNNKEFDGVAPTGAVTVRVEKKKNSSFSVVLQARTEREAVAFTNGYAQFCLREYAEKRIEDLRKWEEVLKKEKQDIFKQIQEINEEKKKLIASLNVVSPEEDYERLRVGLSERQEALAKLKFSLVNLQSREKRLLESLKEINPVLLERKQEIREQREELKKLEREIVVAQELYTEENPRLMGLLSREKFLQERFQAFLKECGLSDKDTLMLDTAEQLRRELKEVRSALEDREEEIRVLEGEMEIERKTMEALTQILPRYQELGQQAASLRDSLQKPDESLADINYLLVLVKDDLFVTEQAVEAVGQKPFRKKNLAIAAFSSIALTGFIIAVMVLLELLFGKVTSEQEMPLRPELNYLGKMPVSPKMFRSDAAKELIFNSICLHLQNTLKEKHVVLAGALPGAKLLQEFFSAVEWTYAMSGKRVLFLDIMLADNVEEELPMDDTGIVMYSGNRGILPIASKRYISPTEQELLKQDLITLQKKYDLILIRHFFAFRHDRLFLERFIPLCESLLIAVGLMKTPRKSLRTLSEIQRSTGITVMTVLSDGCASHFKKIMDMEKESS